MAFASSMAKGQIQIGCLSCKTSNKIKFKCIDCDLLMCENCTYNIHAKVYKKHKHTVIDIKNIGKKTRNSVNLINFNVIKQFDVDMKCIHFMAVSSDGTLFIADNISEELQHIQIENDKVKTLTSLNQDVHGLSISPSGSLLFECGSTSLMFYDQHMKLIKNSKYSVHPFYATSVHMTNDYTIVIGGMKKSGENGVIITMDLDGKVKQKFEKHEGGDPLLKYPYSITTAENGNIFVSDCKSNQVVILKNNDKVQFYRGHPEINYQTCIFTPSHLLTTQNDKILITDEKTFCFHILGSDGNGITYFDPKDIGIIRGWSLALSPSGGIYVGCVNRTEASEESKAKLYELEYSGF